MAGAFDLSDSSDYSGSFWTNEMIYLKPDQSWEKPVHKAVLVTNVSAAFSAARGADDRAILTAVTGDTPLVIASLLRHAPSQQTQLIWRAGQEVCLRSTGSVPVTLTILTKSVD